MKNTANQDLRNAARDAGVPLWAIADVLHISEPNDPETTPRTAGERKTADVRDHRAACKGGGNGRCGALSTPHL